MMFWWLLLLFNVNELKNSFYSSSSLVCLLLWQSYDIFTIHHTPYIHHYSTEQEKQKTKQNKNSTKKILSHWIQFTPWILSSSSYEWWWLFLFDGDFIIVVVVVLNLIFFLIFFRRRRRRRFASSLGSFLLLFSKKKKSTIYTHYVYSGFASASKFTFFFFSLYVFCKNVCVVCFRLRKTYNWWFCGSKTNEWTNETKRKQINTADIGEGERERKVLKKISIIKVVVVVVQEIFLIDFLLFLFLFLLLLFFESN